MRGDTGDRVGALAAIEEAVALSRQLAQDPISAGLGRQFNHGLAMSLNNLSVQRSETGDRVGALAAIEEAVALRRPLAKDDPVVYTPHLAAALNNLSVRRWDTGDRAGALAAAEEASTTYRHLTQANPTVFAPNLATALYNLSDLQDQAGNRAGAIAAMEEAAALRRQYARANPTLVTTEPATALHSLSVLRHEIGDPAGALKALEEAVFWYRKVVHADPAESTSNLARALDLLSGLRTEIGDAAGALAAIEEAVTFYRRLAVTNPTENTPPLATALHNLSGRRALTGDRTGALIAIEEAVALRRRLACTDPAVFAPQLGRSLKYLSARRGDIGDHAGALGAIEEAVNLYRQLAPNNPGLFTPDLASSLNNLSVERSEVGNRAGALEAIDEAVTQYRQLAEAHPAMFTPDLAMVLNNLSKQRGETGDLSGAAEAIEEALILYRQLTRANPAAFTSKLIASTAASTNIHPEPDEAWLSWVAGLESTPPPFVALVQLAAARWCQQQGRNSEARELISRATETAEQPPASPVSAREVGEIRREVRNWVRSWRPPVSEQPQWVILELQPELLHLVGEWAQARGAHEKVRVLENHRELLVNTALAEELVVLDFLHPSDDRVRALQELHREIENCGLECVKADLETIDTATHSVVCWMAAKSWRDSVDYLRKNFIVLNNPHCRAILQELASVRQAAQHLAILNFVSGSSDDADGFSRLLELLTDPEVAAEQALDDLQSGNPDKGQEILRLNPTAVALPGVGGFLVAVLLCLQNRLDDALDTWRNEEPRIGDTQRAAFGVRLKGLIRNTVYPEVRGRLLTLLSEVEARP